MALPSHLLKQLSPALLRASGPNLGQAGLSLGVSAIDNALPDAGLPLGAVVELAVTGGSALATSWGLLACRSAQAQAQRAGGAVPWCAFIDPSATLFGPGVAELGVDLTRLLVVRPPPEALARTALRVVESQAFAVVVIDTAGVLGAELSVELGAWARVVRRIALAIEGSTSVVLLVTDQAARRPLPLPVAQRIELARSRADRLAVRIAKDRRGRLSSPRSVAWTRPPSFSASESKLAAAPTSQEPSAHVRLLP
jgi:hypothetical protein